MKIVTVRITCNEDLFPPDIRRAPTTPRQTAIRTLALGIPDIFQDGREVLGFGPNTGVFTTVDIGRFHVQSVGTPPLRIDVAISELDRQLDEFSGPRTFKWLHAQFGKLLEIEGLNVDWLLAVEVGGSIIYAELSIPTRAARR